MPNDDPFLKSSATPQRRAPLLPLRLRKFIGMCLLLVVLIVYALVIMVIATSVWVPSNGFVEFIFYLVTGLAWTIPAGAIIWWMQRPDAPH